jgi:general secretion pathway protein N
MRQRTLLLTVGGAVFIVVLIATLPASLVASHLPAGLSAENVGGSVWNGGADLVRLRGAPLGALSWSFEPLALASGRLAYRIELGRRDGSVRGRVAATLGGTLEGENLDLDLPLAALDRGPPGNAWQGQLKGHMVRIRLEHGWPTALVGQFTVAALQPPGANRTLGSYAIDFDPGASSTSQLTGRVREVDAPLKVRAQLVIKPDHSYSLDGDVTPKPGAPPEVAQAVAFLGPADAAGRRQFVLGGTF